MNPNPPTDRPGLHLSASLAIALKAIRTNSVRSVLTMLGIIIGIAAAIIAVSIAQGAGQQLTNQIENFGTHTLQVLPGESWGGGRSRGAESARAVTDDDVEALRELDGIEAASGRVSTSVTAVVGNNNRPTSLFGVGADFGLIDNHDVAEGRGVTEAEARRGAKIAVLGQTVANELFEGMNPIGQRLRVNRTTVTVVGVLEEKGAGSWGQDQDDVIWMPLETVRSRVARNPEAVANDAGRIYLKVWEDRDVLEVERDVEHLMRVRRDIQPGANDDFRIANFAEYIRARNETESLLGFLLAAFSATSLVVGGIGIMNIMLVSVTERTREIGLRRAVGARSRDVLTQFLVEATMLGLIGGLVGLLLGVGGTMLAGQLGEFPIVLSPITLAGAVFVAVIIAVFFGYYPARSASKLDPIDALRFE